jgi:hypothetical protein
MTAPERIWIDAWGGNWSPVSGGTQGIEYIRADLAQPAQVRVHEEQNTKQGMAFWNWLPLAYRDGHIGEQAKFTKYNMEVAHYAGWCHAIAAIEPHPAPVTLQRIGTGIYEVEPQPDPRDEVIARLVDAVEAGRDDSEKWRPALGDHGYDAMRAFHGSLDAAKALHDAVLPDFGANIGADGFAKVYRGGSVVTVMQCARIDGMPARAWLLAILRALAQVQK